MVSPSHNNNRPNIVINIAVIFAGGSGLRMHTKSRPRQSLNLNGKPIIIYALELFDNHSDIGAIVVACIEGWIPFLGKQFHKFEISRVVKIIPGGKSGQESIYKGLCAAGEHAQNKRINNEEAVILIHDDVHPLITEKTITDNVKKVEEIRSCITCAPVTETLVVKQVNDALKIPSRADSFVAYAPQGFHLADITTAHRRSLMEGKADFIGSCTTMSHYGYKLGTIIRPVENIKITAATDFFVLHVMMKVHEDQQTFGL